VALPSYALRELREGEDVAERQPWQHQDVHSAAVDGFGNGNAVDGFGNGNQRFCQED
jgi:hypothetical protein